MLRDSGQHAAQTEDTVEDGATGHEAASAANSSSAKNLVSVSSNDNEESSYEVEVLASDAEMPVAVSSLVNITPKQPGAFARLYNGASRAFTRENAANVGANIYNGLKYSFTTKAGLTDLGTGMALGSGLKVVALALGAAGIMTVSAPVIFGLGVAGSVARTVWQMNKERHAYAQKEGFPVANLFSRDFLKAVGQTADWAKDNKKRALTLMGGTVLSTVGVVGGIAAITAIKEWLFDHAPVVPVVVPIKPSVSAGVAAAPHAPSTPVAHAPIAHAPAPQVAPIDNQPSAAPALKVTPVVEAPELSVANAGDTVAAPVDTTITAPAPHLDVDSSVFTADDTVSAPVETPQVAAPVVTDVAPSTVPADAPLFDTAPVSDVELAQPATIPQVAPVSDTVVAHTPVQAPVEASPAPVSPVSATPELVGSPITQSAPPVNQAFNMNIAGNAAHSETFTASLRATPGMFKVGDRLNIEVDQLTLLMK
jgi:hypothetical protein